MAQGLRPHATPTPFKAPFPGGTPTRRPLHVGSSASCCTWTVSPTWALRSLCGSVML